ncbi:unnamed protein product [Brugia timori]|uniref:Photosystem II protein I n=1 Tax=Brugia timori TaxID=42155 RepID=A0A0R3Q994_9BILA|nr:unnamed protein product [Brugia timori]
MLELFLFSEPRNSRTRRTNKGVIGTKAVDTIFNPPN